MKIWIFSCKGFLLSLLMLLAIVPAAHAEEQSSPDVMTWSGIRMITLGMRYMTVVADDAVNWLSKNKSKVIHQDSINPDEDLKKIQTSVVDGLRNTGKILVLLGTAKEYKDYFEFQTNLNNPLNSYNAEDLAVKQNARLLYLQTVLGTLEDKLKSKQIDSSWLTALFDSKAKDHTMTQQSLKFALGKMGDTLEHFKIYGIGIEIVSDTAIGAMLAAIFSKWLPDSIEKIGSKIGYEDSFGIAYILKKKDKSDAMDELDDPLFASLPKDHPIYELFRKDKYRFASTTYGQESARAEGLTYTRSQGFKAAAEISVAVRVTFFASNKAIKDFDLMNMNGAIITEVKAKENLTGIFSGPLKGATVKAQDLIQDAVDKSKHFSFLKESVQISAGHAHPKVNEDTGVAPNIPNFLLRLSVGNFSKELVKGGGFSGLLELSGTFGALSIDARPQ